MFSIPLTSTAWVAVVLLPFLPVGHAVTTYPCQIDSDCSGRAFCHDYQCTCMYSYSTVGLPDCTTVTKVRVGYYYKCYDDTGTD